MQRNTASTFDTRNGRSRRRFLKAAGLAAFVALGAGAGASLVVSPAAAQASQTVQAIADHFSSVQSMKGQFVQFAPNGAQTTGTFAISRPGKMRFDYDAPSPLRLISDGRSVVIGNTKLNTWDSYPLNETPLKLLLSERIDLSGSMVKSVDESPDLVTVVLGDKSVFGTSTITMMFDPNTYDLKQWTMVDAQNRETTVMIMNVETGVQFARNTFEVPYNQMRGTSFRATQ